MSSKKSFLISLKKLKTSDIENLGAEFFNRIYILEIIRNIQSIQIVFQKNKIFWVFSSRLKLKSYEFNKYKSKKKHEEIF